MGGAGWERWGLRAPVFLSWDFPIACIPKKGGILK